MSKTKRATRYTPGPWSLEKSFYHDYFNLVSKDRDSYIGSVNFPEYEKSSEIRLDEAQANARLIATCPEMYEALKTALLALESGHDGPNIKAKLRAAIAKAEGRDQ